MAVHHVFFVLCIDIPVVLIHFASKDALRWRLMSWNLIAFAKSQKSVG